MLKQRDKIIIWALIASSCCIVFVQYFWFIVLDTNYLSDQGYEYLDWRDDMTTVYTIVLGFWCLMGFVLLARNIKSKKEQVL